MTRSRGGWCARRVTLRVRARSAANTAEAENMPVVGGHGIWEQQHVAGGARAGLDAVSAGKSALPVAVFV